MSFATIPFARNSLYMAPAAAADEAITTTTEDEGEALGDRGDDFDPSLFDDDAPSKPAKDASEEETDGTKSETDKGDGKTDGTKSEDDPEAVDKDKAKEPAKDTKQPGRAQKRIQQLTERTAALERQLAEKTGSAETARNLTDLETQAAQLEKEYHKALSEDPEKASDLMRQIRRIDREIARVEAAADAETTVRARLEQRDLNDAIAELTAKYPQLEKGSEDFDQELTTEINAVFQGLIGISKDKPTALRRAVKMVLGEVETKPAGLGEQNSGDKTRESRREEGVKKAVDTVNRQPPSVSNTGTPGSKTPTAIKSIKDLDNMSEEELAKLRGDEG